MIGKAIFNRSPLPPNRLAPLPLGAVTPQGWLREQLLIQAEAAKTLFASWEDVGERCAWLGGEGPCNENAPCFADGVTGLGYLLDDAELIGIASRYAHWAMDSQAESGWFGPARDGYDWWPRMLMLRALQQYFTATGDKRVLQFMDRFFRFQLQALTKHPLQGWAAARAGENMRACLWLYNLTGMSHLLKLCMLLKDQSIDWTSHFHVFPHIRPMDKQRPFAELARGMEQEPDGISGVSQPYYHKEFHLSHGVNVAMALKTPGVVNLFKSGFKELSAFKVGWGKLLKHHGMAPLMFSCDGHLSGACPTQGADLSAIVELMHTLEALIAIGEETGGELPDALERLAFNALPAAMGSDMRAHQRLLQPNQVRITREIRGWYNAGEDANLFQTAADNVTSANLHQGWPRFVSSCWYATADEGLMAVSYAPTAVNFVAGGERVKLNVLTGYPFDTSVRIEVSVRKPVEFPLYLRIPGWAKQAMLRLPDGEIMQLRAGETACVRRRWSGCERVSMDLPMEPRLTRWYHQSAAVELGALTLCYRPKEDWQELPGGAFEVTTKEPWNWALIEGESMKPILEPDEAGPFKGKHSAARVLVKAARAEDWGMDGASAAQPPIAPDVEPDSARVIELIPMGDAALHIVQFPLTPKERE